MTLPTVRMHCACLPFPGMTSLNLSTGPVAISGGTANVPILQVTEAMAKNFAIQDANFAWPPAKTAMCPPSPLTVLRYAAPSPRIDPTTVIGGDGGGANAPGISVLAYTPGVPQARPRFHTYALVTVADGSQIEVAHPGLGVVTIPDQHVAWLKTQGWVLLSDVMPL